MLTFYDVPGRELLRPLWKHFFQRIRGIVFVVDSGEVSRLDEAKTELWRVAQAEELCGVPILVFANKQDLAVGKFPNISILPKPLSRWPY